MSAAFLYLRLFITVHEVEVIVLQRALRFFLTRSGVRVSRFLLGGTAALFRTSAARFAALFAHALPVDVHDKQQHTIFFLAQAITATKLHQPQLFTRIFVMLIPHNLFGSEHLGQHQSQWILMKDAALDKDPQSIILTRVCMRKPSRPSGLLPAAKSHSRFA